MAELAHLEKMGRELECPICLGLLKFAVSLACNHIFCNTCIMESMKSVSDCPVCKIPFHRREIRAAPHMDNLVSIYKSMEVAAGINICSTQMGPPTQTIGDNQQDNSNATETGGKRQKQSNRKKSVHTKKGNEIAITKHSHQRATKPSFPAKKRIHVTPYPISETPLRPLKMAKSEDPAIELAEPSKLVTCENMAPDSEENLSLSPFFWLREDEDDDQSPQKSSSQHLMETLSPQRAPSFSDIKDSADNKSNTSTPANKVGAAVDFDSGMFDWTQRACSPELFLTPQRTQILVETCEVPNGVIVPRDAVPHEEGKIGRFGSRKGSCIKKRNCKVKSLFDGSKLPARSDQCGATGEGAARSGEIVALKTFRKSRRSRGCEESVKCDQNTCVVDLKSQNDVAAVEASEHSPNASIKANDLNVVVNKITEESYRNRHASMHKRKATSLRRSNAPVIPPEVIKDSVNWAGLHQVSGTKFPDASASSCQQVKHGKRRRGRINKRVEEIQTPESGELNGYCARSNGSDITNDRRDEQVPFLMGCSKSANKQTSFNITKDSTLELAANISSDEKVENSEHSILRKCGKGLSSIRCIFCHACCDTEVSGEMLHYLGGKPVAADFNGGVNIIHAHKHCTEWAPDVYFDDDIAINLTAEVSRSKRIKCNSCGVTGAALGCFDKSCRKSFHFTCAKLMPECKWDTENFVMLCPIHSSVKLPNDLPVSGRQNRKRSSPKRSQPSSSNPGGRQSHMWAWPSGSPSKWVLCCSSLSAEEKEIVSKFSKVTGVPVLNTWTPEVTHIIASIDSTGAYKRTLKILKGILDGTWILSVDWIKVCIEVMEPVEEEKFEVSLDVYGISDGPRLGRLRVINKKPKLFSGLKFYFTGAYVASYRGYLQDLVLAAGGTVLKRKPLSRDHERLCDTSTDKIFIVSSVEKPEKHHRNLDVAINRKHCEAQSLAVASGGTLVASTWIIDSIAACKLRPPS